MSENLFQYARMCDSRITDDDVEEYVEINEWDLLIIFKDGRRFIYDRFTNAYKVVYYDSIDKLTDEQERHEFAYRLRSLMGRRWINQDQLAEMVGTSQVMISRYVRGEVMPNALMLRKIAKALKYSMDDFFDRDY